MIRNYFKTAFRSLLNQKVSSLVNVTGLSIGVAGFTIIMLFVFHEQSYERFNKNAKHLFRISPPDNARTAPILSPLLEKDIPEVESSVRVQHISGIFKSNDHFFNEEKAFFADADFPEIFSYDLVAGNAKTALADPYSVIVSQSTAKKYFGLTNAIGQILFFQDTVPLKVTGIYKDLPITTHLKTDVVISFATRKITGAKLDTWDINVYYTYVLLHEHASISGFQMKLNDFVRKNINVLPNRESYKLEAQNIADIHLNSDKAMEIEPNSRISTIRIFISIALFILLIACINYINISTATASRREKEVRLRKTIGARPLQIKKQFLMESVLTVLFSLGIALFLTILFLPILNSLTEANLKITDLFQGWLPFFIIGFVLFAGLLAGIYPVIVLSSFSPVGNLSRKNSYGKQKRHLRHTLVTIQFSMSIILAIGTIIIYNQLNFMKDQSLGFDKDHVLILPFNYDGKVERQYEHLKEEFLKQRQIKYVTESGDIPGKMATTMSFWVEGMPIEKKDNIQTLYVNYDFMPTYGVKILAGRDFSTAIASDHTEGYIINEQAARSLSWSNEEAIGKKITVHSDGKVIGVVNDFHFNSLEQAITPLVIAIRPDWSGYISMRMSTRNIDGTLQYISNTWKKNLPDRPFEYYFLDEDFNKQYLSEERLSKLVTVFATLAFLIAAIGIVGLTIFTIQRRLKEIGVRKVLGASATQISILFSKEFFKPIFLAMLVAFPVAWYVMHSWLQDYAYRVHISWWMFAMAGLIALLVAIVMVSLQAVKAALSNPIKSLRTE
ncbi:MAG TPA: ABC transporter permease [Chitinophagaceae bacterium]|nr:ABC transporter permease [Chitinophagaceae bacterium]